MEDFFILASSKLTLINIYCKDNFGSGSRFQIISASPSPAPQHCFVKTQEEKSIPNFFSSSSKLEPDLQTGSGMACGLLIFGQSFVHQVQLRRHIFLPVDKIIKIFFVFVYY